MNYCERMQHRPRRALFDMLRKNGTRIKLCKECYQKEKNSGEYVECQHEKTRFQSGITERI